MADLARRWSEPAALESRILFSEYGLKRLAELVERIYRDSPASRDDLDAFWTLSAFPLLIEQIGVLHAERAISSRVVYRMWGPQIAAAWQAWREPVTRMRELEGRTGMYASFEGLAREMQIQISANEHAISAAT